MHWPGKRAVEKAGRIEKSAKGLQNRKLNSDCGLFVYGVCNILGEKT